MIDDGDEQDYSFSEESIPEYMMHKVIMNNICRES
jgi:hypothetical protein